MPYLPYWTDVAIAIGTLIIWRFVLYITRKSPFASLKGPPGGNGIEGTFPSAAVYKNICESLFSGHMRSLFDIDHGMDYIESMADDYGEVVKIKGLFGVCYIPIINHATSTYLPNHSLE